jgi:hypothetical protein
MTATRRPRATPPPPARLRLTDGERASLAALLDAEHALDATLAAVLRAQDAQRIAIERGKTEFWRRVVHRLGDTWPVPFDSNWTAEGNIVTGEIRVTGRGKPK